MTVIDDVEAALAESEEDATTAMVARVLASVADYFDETGCSAFSQSIRNLLTDWLAP